MTIENMHSRSISDGSVQLVFDADGLAGASVIDPENGATYHVDIEKISEVNPGKACDCWKGVVMSVPCRHAHAAVRKAGIPISQLMHSMYKARTWKAHYSEALVMPSESDIAAFSHLRDDSLKLPPYSKPPAGRPKSGKRNLGILEQVVPAGKKKRVVCAICNLPGHTQDRCCWRS